MVKKREILTKYKSPASLSGGHYKTAVGAERIGISHWHEVNPLDICTVLCYHKVTALWQ